MTVINDVSFGITLSLVNDNNNNNNNNSNNAYGAYYTDIYMDFVF
jgi:hypothetical protein